MPDNSVIDHLISEKIHSERDRNILRRKFIDGATYDALAEETGMSPRGLKYLVKRHRASINM